MCRQQRMACSVWPRFDTGDGEQAALWKPAEEGQQITSVSTTPLERIFTLSIRSANLTVDCTNEISGLTPHPHLLYFVK